MTIVEQMTSALDAACCALADVARVFVSASVLRGDYVVRANGCAVDKRKRGMDEEMAASKARMEEEAAEAEAKEKALHIKVSACC